MGFPGGSDDKESATLQETQVKSWVKKILWKRGWLPTPVFMPGESHGQKSLVGYSPGGHISILQRNKIDCYERRFRECCSL